MKKKYRIREGSLLWALKKYWWLFLIATAMVFVAFNPAEAKVEAKPEVKAVFQSWDVPLDADLQKYIADTSKEYGIDAELVLAVIGQESDYNAKAIGDSGDSEGLMQIQKKWHSARMEKLGCDDLLDPFQNVTVGIDILADKVNEGGLEWGLMAYNGGDAYADAMKQRGEVSEYAQTVIKLYQELKGE